MSGMLYRSGIAKLALACLASAFSCGVPGTVAGSAFLSSTAQAAESKASVAQIRSLASQAYIWGLAAEFTYRFAKYNTTISSPVNALTYGRNPAAWNNAGTNAGDASVLYINAFLDFTQQKELVLTVPPSRDQYYVVNYLDNFINTVGSIGTRTTPSTKMTSYLLVGPKSKYAGKKVAKIDGHTFPVMASDTNLNWMLIRIGTSTLADSVRPDSVFSVYTGVSKKFALNSLADFRNNGFQPVYPSDYTNTPPTPEEIADAAPYKNTPSDAVEFFKQLGDSLTKSPIPPAGAGLGGTALAKLPPYVVPQYGAKDMYFAPSSGQESTLARYAPIGLTAKGFKIPKSWGPAERTALQQGFEQGQASINNIIASQSPKSDTNYWTILNDIIGTYPNTLQGYATRAIIVLNGGSANVPLDAVYPRIAKYDGVNQLDGNAVYSITFTPPQEGAPLPVKGIFPPQVTNERGDTKGFWSLTVYQPDASEVSSPFLPQTAVLNNAYSKAEDVVKSVNSSDDTITVLEPSWGRMIASTPLLFSGSGAAACGLDTMSDNAVYYVADNPVAGVDNDSGKATYTFKISATWKQDISQANVPIQFSGEAGPPVDLQCNSAAQLSYGVVRPVSQLGSDNLEDGSLVKNPDDSVTIWFAPFLPPNIPAKNWIPTPSTAYYDSIYGAGSGISTTFQVIMRSYYPSPGSQPPSLLPYPAGNMKQSYVPPAIVWSPQ